MADVSPLLAVSGTKENGPITEGAEGADAKAFQEQLAGVAVGMFIGPILDAANSANEDPPRGDSD